MTLVLQRLRGASTGGHADRPARHEHRLDEGERPAGQALSDDDR